MVASRGSPLSFAERERERERALFCCPECLASNQIGLPFALDCWVCLQVAHLPDMAVAKKVWLFGVAGFVVLLNVTQLVYFLLPSFHNDERFSHPARHQAEIHHSFSESLLGASRKPWPVLPSFRPWVSDPKLPPHSCEGYFGNGFTQRIEVFDEDSHLPAPKRKDFEFSKSRTLKTDVSQPQEMASEKEGTKALKLGVSGTRQHGGVAVLRPARELLPDGVAQISQDTEMKSEAAQLEIRQPRRKPSRQLTQLERKGAVNSQRLRSQSPSGSLRCFYSETLRTSICEGRKMAMHPERIRMSVGGEPVESVIGRSDEEELPSFSPGAFEILLRPNGSAKTLKGVIGPELLDLVLPQGQIHQHTMRFLFNSIRTVSSDQVTCSEEIVEPTLLVTRFEYANLFHTATDWYSAYAASRVLDLPQRPNVIFVDGHCQSSMDDGWKALFSNVRYSKNFTGSVCFNHVIFTPLGYETALFKGLNSGIPCKGCQAAELEEKVDHEKTARLREFGEMFKAAFGVMNTSISNKEVKVLFVRRESYLAHPRHAGMPELRLRNEQELFDSLKTWAQTQSQAYSDERQKVSIINGLLAHMKMEEQVQAVQEASIVIGVHGAGLTHIIFARPGTVILELLSPLFPRPHYSHISQWMGLEYHSIKMAGTVADCTEVLERLTKILKGLQSQRLQ